MLQCYSCQVSVTVLKLSGVCYSVTVVRCLLQCYSCQVSVTVLQLSGVCYIVTPGEELRSIEIYGVLRSGIYCFPIVNQTN